MLPNALPVGQVTLAAGTATPVRAGYPFTAVVQATDRERLLKGTLTATGPVTPTTQTTTVTGTAAPKVDTSGLFGARPVLLWADAGAGDRLAIPFELADEGVYALRLTAGAGPDRGTRDMASASAPLTEKRRR